MNWRLGYVSPCLKKKKSSGDDDVCTQGTLMGLALHVTHCAWGSDCLWLSCILWKTNKTKRASVLCMSFGICKHTFFFNVFKVCLDFWYHIQSCMMHSTLPPKNYFVFSKTLHVLLELHRRCWFGIFWITEHMGIFTVLSLGRVVCKLRTAFGFVLFCCFLLSDVNILLFKFLITSASFGHSLCIFINTHNRST